jgi:hypothetical protein
VLLLSELRTPGRRLGPRSTALGRSRSVEEAGECRENGKKSITQRTCSRWRHRIPPGMGARLYAPAGAPLERRQGPYHPSPLCRIASASLLTPHHARLPSLPPRARRLLSLFPFAQRTVRRTTHLPVAATGGFTDTAHLNDLY